MICYGKLPTVDKILIAFPFYGWEDRDLERFKSLGKVQKEYVPSLSASKVGYLNIALHSDRSPKEW